MIVTILGTIIAVVAGLAVPLLPFLFIGFVVWLLFARAGRPSHSDRAQATRSASSAFQIRSVRL